MTRRASFGTTGPGRHAPARFACALAALIGLAGPALGQQAQPAPPAPAPAAPPPSSVPIPDALEINKLIWSTMAAVDHANQAGNYSVLRDLAAPGFQAANDSARLATIFQGLRASGIDLSNALLLAPTLSATPQLVQPGVIQISGFFGLRPTAITFDLVYQWQAGRWKLFGVSIAPATLTSVQPAPARPQQQPPPPRPQPTRRN